MTRYAGLACVLALVWVACPRPAQAASCAITSPGGATLVDFGIYSAMGGDADGSGSINLMCTGDAPLFLPVSYTLAIGPGGAAGFNPRRLSAGAFGLNYNLYRDLLRLLVWGDGSAGSSTQSGLCGGACAQIVYGRVFSGQAAPGGQYSDQVLITLDF